MRAVLFALLLSLLAPATAAAAPLVETLKSEGYGLFAGWIESAQFNWQLADKGPFTVLAPSDAAIRAQLSEAEIAELSDPANAARLWTIVTYHTWPGAYSVAELTDWHVVHSMAYYAVTIFDLKSGLQLNNAKVLGSEIAADNGTIIPIDKVFVQAGK